MVTFYEAEHAKRGSLHVGQRVKPPLAPPPSKKRDTDNDIIFQKKLSLCILFFLSLSLSLSLSFYLSLSLRVRPLEPGYLKTDKTDIAENGRNSE